ncbi:acyl-CoA N-acyltransferase [Scenedesmus sp. NREL 46B-D3]|nr:acyl-CoA N-acyltransferase [Scenedesmus sp. NREL 46B-D3]
MSPTHSAEEPPLLKPPGAFTACRWFCFCATVAIAIGMLALIDQHLLGVKWIYDGPLEQYQGRPITVSYCLLSPSTAVSVDGNCNFARAAAALSLALSLIWPYIQVGGATNAGLVRSRVVKNRRGYWRIRHFQSTDLHAVADLQAAAFHEALPVGALDRLAYTMFKAEVLDALKKKVDVLCEHGFAMMVVEDCQVGSSGSCSLADSSALDLFSVDAASRDGNEECSEDWESAVCVLGVVEVGVQDEADVLQHLQRSQLPSSGTYAYITSMAVAPHLRRCGVGRALLQAAEQQATNWEQELVALHVYESNAPAIRLYERHGMRCCAQDPAWKGMLGGKVRQLMVKPVSGLPS